MKPEDRVGTAFGGYQIESIIGRGGMGLVFRAEHVGLKRRVALKLLTPQLAGDESFRQRFVRESQLAASIDHPNIIPIYEAGEIDGEYFLAMRYVDGTDLDTRLRDGPPLEIAETVAIVEQVAEALDAAHAAGLVHRDVKPGNVLIAARAGGERGHVYLTDFGLTKRTDSKTGLTAYGSFLGSLDYVAPEQIQGKTVDGRADQYALGCLLYHCLTGKVPFDRDTEMAMLWAHVQEPPPAVTGLRPDLPAALDGVLATAMAKAPDERYPTCRALTDALRDELTAASIEVAPPPSARSQRWVLAGVAAVALAVAALGAWALFINDSSGGLAGGSPTAGPTIPAPTPESTVFPTAAETALIGRLPTGLAGSCVRATSGAPRTEFGGEMVYSAGIDCTLPEGAGAELVTYWDVTRLRSSSAQPAEPARIAFFARQGQVGAPLGDCATEPEAWADWSFGGIEGSVLCYTSGEGRATLVWIFEGENIYAVASRADTDVAALYRWWEDEARSLRE